MKFTDKKSCFAISHARSAFTLAEVLITLGIIGVVAAMTIPTLMNNIQDAQYKTAYKKAYSTLAQAWLSCVNEGSIEARTEWTGNGAVEDTNFLAFEEKLKVIKSCDSDPTSMATCWDVTGEKYSMSSPLAWSSLSFVDASGFAWIQENQGQGILVDTNGLKKPNQYGKDRFAFQPIVTGGNIHTPGVPDKIQILGDFPSINAGQCPSGGCYYSSWLLNN